MAALLATSAQALRGRRSAVLPIGRRVGQMMIGIGVGLTFSRHAARTMAPPLVAAVAWLAARQREEIVRDTAD